jgi:CDP-paratose 2-epimerase
MVRTTVPGPAVTVVLVTGSGGLIGSHIARHFGGLGLDVVGIDNDMRRVFFGPDGSTLDTVADLRRDLGGRYRHHYVDVRNRVAIDRLVRRDGRDITLVVHTAAQPSHDLADEDPTTDWDINAGGTLNLLDAVRRYAPDAVFVHFSTIKVYGPHPNRVPLADLGTRLDWDSPGFDETVPIDGGPRSLFGASKTAADVMVQEFGHAYGLRTVCLRAGCLTGSAHAAAEMHGFLAYLMRAVMERRVYRIIGYGGKQVRDNLHATDVATAVEALFRHPPVPGSVFNLGGGRGTDTSVLEAVALAEQIVGQPVKVEHAEARRGDHRWWITDTAKFRARYADWAPTYNVPAILREIHQANAGRWRP